jgi:hypothetical protein
MSRSTGSISRQEKTRMSAGFLVFLVGHRGFEPRTLCLKDSGKAANCVYRVQIIHFVEHIRTQLSNATIISIYYYHLSPTFVLLRILSG